MAGENDRGGLKVTSQQACIFGWSLTVILSPAEYAYKTCCPKYRYNCQCTYIRMSDIRYIVIPTILQSFVSETFNFALLSGRKRTY